MQSTSVFRRPWDKVKTDRGKHDKCESWESTGFNNVSKASAIMENKYWDALYWSKSYYRDLVSRHEKLSAEGSSRLLQVNTCCKIEVFDISYRISSVVLNSEAAYSPNMTEERHVISKFCSFVPSAMKKECWYTHCGSKSVFTEVWSAVMKSRLTDLQGS